MRFADIAGHEAAVGRLRRVVLDDRPAPAYLLSGPGGIGKRAVADAFATELLCATPAADGACGTCPQCVRAAAGTHPDVTLVARDADRRDIRTEQVRELTRRLTLRPLMGRRAIALIDGAEALNEHGQNALLKTLEEPPGAAVLVLCATRASVLLPTVRSRCQHIRLGPLADGELARFLAARGVPGGEVAALVGRAAGVPGRALALRDDPQAGRATLLEGLGRLSGMSAAEVSALAQSLGRTDVAPALETVASWYRDLLGLVAGSETPLRNPDAADALRAAAVGATVRGVVHQLEAVCATIDAIERNANRVLALESMLLALRQLARDPERAATWTSPPR